jgi:DNA-binding MarR family transcriptional regulator
MSGFGPTRTRRFSLHGYDKRRENIRRLGFSPARWVVVYGHARQYVGGMIADSRPDTSGQGESDDVTRAMDAVRAIVRALRINTRAIELKIGISLAQLFVLQQVAERPAESLNDLAERTATHQSSVSVVVRRLVDRGLVTRRSSSVDKRRVQIAVTPAGEAILKGAPRTIQVRLMTAMEKMPTPERRELADLMEKWLVCAGISFTAPPMMGEADVEDEI